jgi:hypothetical protein
MRLAEGDRVGSMAGVGRADVLEAD